MGIQTAVASKKFLALLSSLQGSSVKRKDLLTLAVNHLKINHTQAEGLVARNIHKLQRRHGLISSSGKQGERTYHILPPLLELISQNRQIESKLSDQDRLQQERRTADAELQILRGEIQAYCDLLTTYPDSRKKITALIKEATEHAHILNGRLNALNKIIHLSNS